MYTYKIVKSNTLNLNYKTGYAIVIYKDNIKLDNIFFRNRKDTITYSGRLYLDYPNIKQIYNK